MEEKQLLKDCLKEMDIPLTEEMAAGFMKYMSVLLEWNEKMNLTAITDKRQIVLKHFADSLSLVPYLDIDENTSIIDVGTGAGFPGLPVKIVRPKARLTLLDSLKKRIGFLEEVVRELGLEGVECIHSRAEDGGRDPVYREKFDYCLSRAVANMSVLAEYCLPFVRVGGVLAALKGPDVVGELSAAEDMIKKLGGSVLKVEDVVIPYTDLSHKLVFIEKISPTPKAYPRRAGKIK